MFTDYLLWWDAHWWIAPVVIVASLIAAVVARNR
jgi:hypothetical protein